VSGEQYTAVHVEGGLLPADLIARIASADRELPGNKAEDYHLAAGERLGEAASRKWDYLLGAYRTFRERLDKVPETESGASETRERWLLRLLDELGFGRVPFIRSGLSVDGTDFPVSHLWGHVPMHLVGWRTDLDRRTSGGQKGRAPQSMLQEFLNKSDDHLWGVLSNGRLLRILRDSTALVGSSYVEFDLEAIFDGELYSEFVLLFALLHSSRFELLHRDDGSDPTPADCWLERWRTHAIETGTRAREQLRERVEQALNELGTGFLEVNPALRDHLASGRVSLEDFRHELLRLAYQLIFLFVAEDRGALLEPDPKDADDDVRAALREARERYAAYFSTARLRRIASRRRGDTHGDLWRTLVVVLDALGSDEGRAELALPPLGGLFFRAGDPLAGEVNPDLLRTLELGNVRFLTAVRLLSNVIDKKGRPHRVDYQHLGAEELGSIYESLLERVPRHDPAVPRFWLEQLAGNQRKTTGSYYTPTPLIDELLKTTLDPLISEHAESGVPDDLLKITVCDPACGSGHFLVAAARRIAKKYAAMYTGDEEPTPAAVREAMYKVVARCVYGVDLNPMAAELAKVSLWLESLEPGKPLAFLDAHIKIGNSLLGTTPKLLEQGIPDEAFKPIEGDDRKIVSALRKQNAIERAGQKIGGGQEILDFGEPFGRTGNTELAEATLKLAALPVRSLPDIREQARRLRALDRSSEKQHAKRLADAWCAAFVWRKHTDAPPAITSATLSMLKSPEAEPSDDVASELGSLAGQYRFFHWHLEFPDVFRVEDEEAGDANPDTGWSGGFTSVLGNPPWERVKIQEKEFFATRNEKIANARNAATRKKLIAALADSELESDRRLHAAFTNELRLSAGWSHLFRDSGRYPLTGQGDVNTYSVFAETARTIVRPRGRSGLVLPTGIATDATTAPFFGDLVRTGSLVAFLEFENEEFLLSADVHHSFRFALISMGGRRVRIDRADFAFGSRSIVDVEPRRFTMPPEDILLLNPNTGTTPLFRSRRDADITLGVYRRIPVLWRESPTSNPWKLSFMAMFHMANDSDIFHTRAELEGDGWILDGNIFSKGGAKMLPLYEAKMIHQFDHRLGTYEGQTQAQANMGTLPRLTPEQKRDPSCAVLPRYWVAERDINERLGGGRRRGWLLGWRDIARSTDERTVIFSLSPWSAVGHTSPLMMTTDSRVPCIYANLNTWVLDYCVRQKMGGTHLTYGYLKQLPVLPPESYGKSAFWDQSSTLSSWFDRRVLELTYTAWDLKPFAQDVGDDGPPFVWNDDRRFFLRAELDAAFFHLYGIERDNVDYIMDSFRAFRNNDLDRFERTKSTIGEIYEAMARAMESGDPYLSLLDPPPGEGRRHVDERRHEGGSGRRGNLRMIRVNAETVNPRSL
jgi:type I restriction-modification system DNA methylase subunit